MRTVDRSQPVRIGRARWRRDRELVVHSLDQGIRRGDRYDTRNGIVRDGRCQRSAVGILENECLAQDAQRQEKSVERQLDPPVRRQRATTNVRRNDVDWRADRRLLVVLFALIARAERCRDRDQLSE